MYAFVELFCIFYSSFNIFVIRYDQWLSIKDQSELSKNQLRNCTWLLRRHYSRWIAFFTVLSKLALSKVSHNIPETRRSKIKKEIYIKNVRRRERFS